MNTIAPKMPTPAEIEAWPKFTAWTLGTTPGPTSNLHRTKTGNDMWIFGGLLYDTNSGTISAYSMKDATTLERTSVSQTLELHRRRWFQNEQRATQ
ncbi:hypothetical protein [Kocuria rhizophila]|uniref:hypothetical protein n=1 Tax=Kocuria rhizophila TaxID=72000 RepID=UPI00073D72DF|nr:hypothetical protein [Kocuria rhizophila]